MADYPQERAAGKLKLPKPKNRLTGLELPQPPKKRRSKRDRALAELLRDFRLGLTSLRSLAQRLKVTRPDYKGQRGQAPAVPPAITKIVERERKVVERLVASLPASERKLVIKEYERATQQVMTAQAPQAYAAILRASELVSPTPASPSAATTVQPAPVLRPDQPYVKELMATAKAIRAGRLPFMPKEVVRRARELLSVLFGKQRATDLITSRDVVTRKLISQYRLVPRSVQAATSVTPRNRQTRVQQEMQALISKAITPRPSTAGTSHRAPVELAELEKRGLIAPQDVAALPAMHTGGVAGPGEYRRQAKEGVEVITQADSLVNVPPADMPTAATKEEASPTAPGGSRNVTTKPVTAPPPAKSTPPVMGMRDPKGVAATEPGLRAPINSDTSAQGNDTLKVKDIAGLAEWISRAEERLSKFDG
jgi:hypothetical protein